jgi:hypothetical protein
MIKILRKWTPEGLFVEVQDATIQEAYDAMKKIGADMLSHMMSQPDEVVTSSVGMKTMCHYALDEHPKIVMDIEKMGWEW